MPTRLDLMKQEKVQKVKEKHIHKNMIHAGYYRKHLTYTLSHTVKNTFESLHKIRKIRCHYSQHGNGSQWSLIVGEERHWISNPTLSPVTGKGRRGKDEAIITAKTSHEKASLGFQGSCHCDLRS